MDSMVVDVGAWHQHKCNASDRFIDALGALPCSFYAGFSSTSVLHGAESEEVSFSTTYYQLCPRPIVSVTGEKDDAFNVVTI